MRAAAQEKNVSRIFVTPSIKVFHCSCKDAGGLDTEWLMRLRPYDGHDDHIHVRLICPPGEPCVEQEPPPEGDGCGQELGDFLKKVEKDPPYKSNSSPEEEPYKPFSLKKLPPECRELLNQ